MAGALESVEVEVDAPAEGTLVDLVTEAGEAEILVPPPGKWKTRAQTFLTQGAYDLWAQITLSKDDFKAWRDLDPTLDEATAFLEAWEKEAGQNLGKSRASRRSSKNTRKR
ncbi:MAG: hypothetical protein JWO67_4183 [Streptosporangiaceae bacterium]|nr:hypothetical protein [Streptosporangiaceae bacterium]